MLHEEHKPDDGTGKTEDVEDPNMSDSADLDSYISTHVLLHYTIYKIHLYRYHHLHPESRMLWKKLVQFGKGF